jgi:hypothetical protein
MCQLNDSVALEEAAVSAIQQGNTTVGQGDGVAAIAMSNMYETKKDQAKNDLISAMGSSNQS